MPLSITYNPAVREENLRNLKKNIEDTSPRDCGHVHEIEAVRRLNAYESPIPALCSEKSRWKNPACAHRLGNAVNPYRQEINDAYHLGAITKETFDRLLDVCSSQESMIFTRDRDAQSSAFQGMKMKRFPLEVIQEGQRSESIPVLVEIRRELLESLDAALIPYETAA